MRKYMRSAQKLCRVWNTRDANVTHPYHYYQCVPGTALWGLQGARWNEL